MFENVMAILNKCREKDLNDILVAEDMLIAEDRENEEKIKCIKKAGDFLGKYYKEITKCNRLGLIDKIKEICEAENDNARLSEIFKELEKVEG